MSDLLAVWLIGIVPALVLFGTTTYIGRRIRFPRLPWDTNDTFWCCVITIGLAIGWWFMWILATWFLIDDYQRGKRT